MGLNLVALIIQKIGEYFSKEKGHLAVAFFLVLDISTFEKYLNLSEILQD